MVSNLSFELACPVAWNTSTASRTTAVGGQAIVFHKISIAPNDRLSASVTSGVFMFRYDSRQVSGVDISQTSILADRSRAPQIFWARIVGIVHLVILVESGDVPGNEGRDIRQKIRQAPQFILRVVEAW